MESDDESDEIVLNDEHYPVETTSEQKNFFEFLQYLIPQNTILYIQYCLLRIPFLLIYDYFFSEQFFNLIQRVCQFSIDRLKQENQTLFQPIISLLDNSLFHTLIHLNLHLSIPILGSLVLVLLLLCTDQRLVLIYSYSISFYVFYFYYQFNYHQLHIQWNIFILQFLLSLIYLQMLNMRSQVRINNLQKSFCYCAPILYFFTRYFLSIRMSCLILNIYYCLWLICHLLEIILYQRESIYHFLRYGILTNLLQIYHNLGLQVLLNYLQEHIHFLTLLKLFWLVKISVIPLCIRMIYTQPFVKNATIEYTNETLINTIYFTTMFYGTETIFCLISLSCIISTIMKILTHRLFRLLHLWNEEVEQIGTVIGIMFFLLLFQSNITQLNLDRRHIPLLKAFSLLFVAILHFLHTVLEPQLLKIAMQTVTKNIAFEQNKEKTVYQKILSSYQHRYVYTCVTILILQFIFIIILWNLMSVSTWLLAITAFLLELIVRLTASLAQYTLYVLDAHNYLTNIDSFDEYIFRIKAVTAICEFCLGVFLLINGLYILFYEAGGAIRACMLAIHAHLNIIKNVKRGWQILHNRRSAWTIVSQLPLANQEQIDDYNDICSICHSSLTVGNTCITPCSHLYHQKCLQKTFYATQTCALCSRPITIEKTS